MYRMIFHTTGASMTSPNNRRGAFPWQHIPSPGKIFGTATVGERGQIAIPADARKEMSIKSGDKLVVFGNKISGSLVLVSADVFEDFADSVMSKLTKLGEHAEAFFDQFTEPGDAGEPPVDADIWTEEAGATEDTPAPDAASEPPVAASRPRAAAKTTTPRGSKTKAAAKTTAAAKSASAKTAPGKATESDTD
jgi:AbrB family looped-hinge helix DNA binding protein